MCGIVGYIGFRQAPDILIDRLESLSYRGYDSAGIGIFNGGSIDIVKTKGKISRLRELLKTLKPEGTMGVGHTRWATHGEPNDINAHPHSDCSGDLIVVQNGIVENYRLLKAELEAKGHKFISQTDTEILSHLVEEYYDGDLMKAVKTAIKRVVGNFAVVFMHKNEERLIAARFNAPLIVGLAHNENFVASDVPALLKDTNKFYIMHNGDIVAVGKETIEVDTFLDRSKVDFKKRNISIIDWTLEDTTKGDYEYYMLKEIHEQPKAIERTIEGHISKGGYVYLDITIPEESLRQVRTVHLVACGTAYHACLYGKFVLEETLGIPVLTDIASEFRYRNPLLSDKDLAIFVSQSGETADTLASLDLAHERGVLTLAITNVMGSSITRMADSVVYTQAGPEIAVASTKAFTSQQVVFLLLAGYLCDVRRVKKPKENIREVMKALKNLPDMMRVVLDGEEACKKVAEEIAQRDDCYYLGRNIDEPLAREGALKLKEISYIHSEAFPAGELKHGTIALIDEGTPVIAIMTQDEILEKSVSNVQEVLARRGVIYIITRKGVSGLEDFSRCVLYVPNAHRYITPILSAVPLQLIAYYSALARGYDVDMPRNLAKSVTVE
ncbi:MAG: glutamine--fructose-6-phosphate transaminase (isomerizing) [bacterium]